MRWYSNRRSPSPPDGTQWYRLLMRAACCARPSYGARPTIHCQWGITQQFFVFCPWWPWPLTFDLWPWPSNSGEICTVYLTAKFDRPMFSRSEVIMRTNWQTNKQTPLKTSTALRYATPVSNKRDCSRWTKHAHTLKSFTPFDLSLPYPSVNQTACADFSTGVAAWRHACCDVIMPIDTMTAPQDLARIAPYHALSMRMTQQFFVFIVLGDLWPLTLTFELGRDFCTMHLTTKFHHPTFSRSEVIVRTNRQIN